MNKWFSLSLGAVLGVTHIGLIGLIATNNRNSVPKIDIPVGDYTSYVVQADKEGYKISYKANDPKTAYLTKDIKKKGGFLGLANNTTKVAEEYFMDGKTNQGGPVSNKRSWIDSPPGLTQEQAAAISAERIACIKAVGSGEGTGRVVGTSIGAAAAPAVSGIPFVGWVAAGWVAMFGGNQGAEIGGSMAEEMSKDC
tara:strand:- start:2646 stop:3233 length:588 start_codon:yes stop_codon:yes gene_type:complete